LLARRAQTRKTAERCGIAPRREVTLQSTNKIRGAPLVSRRLIGRLTGCVDIVEIENRQRNGRIRNIGLRALAAERRY